MASHWCERSTAQRQWAFLVLPEAILAGVRSPFLVGCHSAAMPGKSVASELVAEALWPAQDGHPVPRLTRLAEVASHWWSGPTEQDHQYFWLDPATTWSGERT